MKPTEEAICRVLNLYDDNYTFNQIAVSTGLTKGQVAGIVYRLSKKRKETKKTLNHQYTEYLAILSPPRGMIPAEGLPLLECPNDGCRFAVGQTKAGSHLFCAQIATKGSYCGEHYQKMYNTKTLVYYK